MSPSYDSYDRRSSRRSVWTHWIPLAVTLAAATAGAAAWIWSQRRDDDDNLKVDLDYHNADHGKVSTSRPPNQARDLGKPAGRDDESHGEAPMPSEAAGSGWGARVSDVLRRTPSPQQLFDSTGKTVVAGVAAAGAVVGKALASIREEDKAYSENPWSEEEDKAYSENPWSEEEDKAYSENPWSEEADAKQERAPAAWTRTRKAVVVVVSADASIPKGSPDGSHELATILSHIPRHNDLSTIKLYVLIYAPDLKETTLDGTTSNIVPASLSSSFSNIGHDQVQSPGENPKSPVATSPGVNAAFNAIYSQALDLVDKETMILPFTTPTGHVHILRHIQPEIIYLQESLSGENGSIITNLQTWLRHDVILVVGAESGSGGLAGSESEAEKSEKAEKWWQRLDKVGRGRGVVVVDGMRMHDDWMRRVQGRE